MKTALIIAYVEDFKHSPRLRQVASTAVAQGAILICADSGGDVAKEWGLQPALLLGDMDSINPATLHFFEQKGVPIERFPAAKDETDLELAARAAVAQGCTQLKIVGGTGGRLDQMLGNLLLPGLASFTQTDLAVTIIGEREEIRLLQGDSSLKIEGAKGDIVSLILLSTEVTGITTTNLRYPLRDETLFFGSTRGISNEILTSPAQVKIKSGTMLVVQLIAGYGHNQ